MTLLYPNLCYNEVCYKGLHCTCQALDKRTFDWALTRENLLWGFANNKGADQPVHPRRSISAFVFRILESIISNLATSEISTFWLVYVAEQPGLNLA